MSTTATKSPADIALRNVALLVTKMIPRGFGGDRYWEMTVSTHDVLMDAYHDCKKSDTERNRDTFRGAAQDWTAAWASAIEAWTNEQSQVRTSA